MCAAVSWTFLSIAEALGLQEIPAHIQCQSPQKTGSGLSCIDWLCATGGAGNYTTCMLTGSKDCFDLILNGF